MNRVFLFPAGPSEAEVRNSGDSTDGTAGEG